MRGVYYGKHKLFLVRNGVRGKLVLLDGFTVHHAFSHSPNTFLLFQIFKGKGKVAFS